MHRIPHILDIKNDSALRLCCHYVGGKVFPLVRVAFSVGTKSQKTFSNLQVFGFGHLLFIRVNHMLLLVSV